MKLERTPYAIVPGEHLLGLMIVRCGWGSQEKYIVHLLLINGSWDGIPEGDLQEVSRELTGDFQCIRSTWDSGTTVVFVRDSTRDSDVYSRVKPALTI